VINDPKNPQPPVEKGDPHEAGPVAKPLPPMDGKKPIPEGSDQVERFNVATDTEGGD
jgi:hypothetical protein